MRAYSDSPMVEAALKQQQAEVDAIEKEWKQADKALSAYDSKISGLEAKLNSAKAEAGGIQQNMAKAGPSSEKMAKSVDKAQKSAILHASAGGYQECTDLYHHLAGTCKIPRMDGQSH